MLNNIPIDCKVKRHTTSMNGILYILKDGCTKDTITLIKECYNNEQYNIIYDDITETNKYNIDKFHGIAEKGIKLLNGTYDNKIDISNNARNLLNVAPKGHYVYVDSLDWNKGIPSIIGKKVQIYYKWNIDKLFPKGSIMVRDYEEEHTPTQSELSKLSIPNDGGEIIYPKGIDCKHFMCITVTSNYKDNVNYKKWSNELTKLCNERNIKLFWITPGSSTTMNVFDIYKKYGNEKNDEKK